MHTGVARTISLVEAARIIYGTSQPSAEQVQRVQEKLKSGQLKGNCTGRLGRWTTSDQDVAEYLASQSLLHQGAKRAASGKAARSALATNGKQRRQHDAAELRTVYTEVLRDYFLAVILRRKLRSRSQQFQRAVVVGQALTVLGIALLCLTTVRMLRVAAPPEQVAIETWIAENAGDFKVVQWHPPKSDPQGGLAVRVVYTYFTEGRKPITTDRVFLVRDDQVAAVTTTD